MSSIWFNKTEPPASFEGVRSIAGGLGSALEMRFKELGDNVLVMHMPIKDIHKQPAGIVHGGSYCALAEGIASIASNLTLDLSKQMAVGQQLSINYIRSATAGTIIAKTSPTHLGRSSQIWDITMHLEETGKLLSKGTLTLAILNR